MIPAVLGAIGFGSGGVIAGARSTPACYVISIYLTLDLCTGTAAAGIQAGIGNVAAGSLFAMVQSFAMGGAAAVAVGTVGTVLVGGAAVGAVALGAVEVVKIVRK